MFKTTSSFLKAIKDLQKDKNCRKIEVLKKIVEEVINHSEEGLINIFSDRTLKLAIFKKRLPHPCVKGGKSGGLRIIFAFYEDERDFSVIFAVLYSKRKRENMLPNEVMKIIQSDPIEDLSLDFPQEVLEKLRETLRMEAKF